MLLLQWFWCCWCRYYTGAEVVQQGGAKKVVQVQRCRCSGSTEHRVAERCREMQTEMQRCEVHRHGGEEVQRCCSKVVKMFSGAE